MPDDSDPAGKSSMKMPPYVPTCAIRSRRAFTPVVFPPGWVDVTRSGETVVIVGNPNPPRKKLGL